MDEASDSDWFRDLIRDAETLRAEGTPAALAGAVAACDAAIELLLSLDISVAENRQRLAIAHMEKGRTLCWQGTPAALAAAVAA